MAVSCFVGIVIGFMICCVIWDEPSQPEDDDFFRWM